MSDENRESSVSVEEAQPELSNNEETTQTETEGAQEEHSEEAHREEEHSEEAHREEEHSEEAHREEERKEAEAVNEEEERKEPETSAEAADEPEDASNVESKAQTNSSETEQPGKEQVKEERAEGAIPRDGPNGVDMDNALAKARAIAAKLGSINRAAAAADVEAAEPRAGGEADAAETSRKRTYEAYRTAQERPDAYDEQPAESRRRVDGEGAEGESAESFPVASQLVGLIIGRGGENLKSIERRNAVRVQFNPDFDKRDPTRQITITGPGMQCAAAKQDILEFIDRHNQMQQQPFRPAERNPAPDELAENVTIMVPNAKVGLIIGRGGENIRQIQFNSGARVQVQPETDRNMPERPIVLIGAPEQIDAARAKIMEYVNMEQRSPVANRAPRFDNASPPAFGQGEPPARFQDRFASGSPVGAAAQHVDEMQVPSEAVGIIIGRGGESIKYLQQASGARIQIIQGQDRSNSPFKPVTITGHPAACQRARQMIEEKIEYMNERKTGGGFPGSAGREDREYAGGRGHRRQDYHHAPGGSYPPSSAQGMYGGSRQGYDRYSQQQPAHNGASSMPDQAGQQQQWSQYYGGQQQQYGYQGYQGQQQHQHQQQQAPASGAASQNVQWTNQQTADYYAQYAVQYPEYAQYAQYYRQLAEKDPNGIVPSSNTAYATSAAPAASPSAPPQN